MSNKKPALGRGLSALLENAKDTIVDAVDETKTNIQ